jgi:hypothetical protein
MPKVRVDPDAPTGCVVAFLLLWLVGVLLILGFWASVAYLVLKFASTP